jgi:hypothetical protein
MEYFYGISVLLDIEDEQMCKKERYSWIEKHGEDVLLFANEENKDRILESMIKCLNYIFLQL